MKISGEGNYSDATGRRHKIKGFGTFSDDMPLQSLNVSGELSFRKISCDTIKVSGEGFGDSLTAKKFSAEGTLKINSIRVSEILKVTGILKAANITADEIIVASRNGSIGTIKCRRIKIFETNDTQSNSRVRIKSIDAETVEIENCAVEVIRCRDAVIGTNCAIEKLIVAGKCTVAADSTVDETIHT